MTKYAVAFRMARRALYALAAALLLAAAYPASRGPAAYAVGRGWLTPPLRIYSPLQQGLKSWPEVERFYYRYMLWCLELGREHSGRPWPDRDRY
ncbi:MAG TPA: hypothetical protein VF170_12795 [Planctomycetaceae bacterium]